MANSPEERAATADGLGPPNAELARRIVDGLTVALPNGTTLSDALRAAADECESRASVAALTRLAERAERGEPFESLLRTEHSGLPAALVATLRSSGAGDGREDVRVAALARWTYEQGMLEEVEREIRAALAYPATIIYLASLTIPLTAVMLAPSFQLLMREFEMQPMMLGQGLDAMAASGFWMLTALLLLPVLLIALRVIGGAEFWRTWCGQLPLIGPLWRWLALAGWARWLALLVDARVPLAEGVRLAGASVQDSRIHAASHRLATRVALGGGLGLAMADTNEWPATATVIVGWGERTHALPESLRALAETCESRARLRARWARLVAPSFAFIFVGLTVACVYWMMLSPMMTLISLLT